jgi:hypothetical protein
MIVPNANATVPQILVYPEQWHAQVLVMAALLVVVGVLASLGVFIVLVLSPLMALAYRRRRNAGAKAKAGITDTSQQARQATSSDGTIASTSPSPRPRHLAGVKGPTSRAGALVLRLGLPPSPLKCGREATPALKFVFLQHYSAMYPTK